MDLEKIEEIIKLLESSNTEELIVRKGDTAVSLKKMHKSIKPKKQQVKKEIPHKEAANEETFEAITAPMVGLFHLSEDPIKVGDRISIGQVVGSIESMKLVNDVVSRSEGIVKDVLVEDGTPVEYGQHLFHLEKSKEA
ncbi:MAG: biotin/lipoyl-containing protein [Armatimonadota bacterium]